MALPVALSLAMLVACGGGGGAGGADTPPAAEPVARIDSPAPGTLFSAGERIRFEGVGLDAQQRPLPASSLIWWAELHHDEHTHPAQLPMPGASGELVIPRRGETSEHIFYRFHLRATDAGGRATETTRDVLPRKARITLTTEPPGLALMLDGQPVASPFVFTGVVGVERDLGAADQAQQGRRWQFDGWTHGGAAQHTIVTPAADTAFTARFIDIGPAPNEPPAVRLIAPPSTNAGTAVTLQAEAQDRDGRVARVDFLEGDMLLGSATRPPFAHPWTPVAAGTAALRARAFDEQGAGTDSAVVQVSVLPASGGNTVAPVATLTAPVPWADGLDGVVVLAADASDDVGVVAVEFQVDGVRVGNEVTSAPYSASVDTTRWASGQHVVRARARDEAGNRSAWSQATVRFAGARELPAGFSKDEGWVSGLDAATAFAQAPDGRWFVAEQPGTLRVVKDGVLLATPFHTFAADAQGERGLLGVALHPDFARNGWVYTYHTRVDNGIANNRVTRLTAAGDVSTGEAAVFVDLPALEAFNHNGGALEFAADGKLVVAVGDNQRPLLAQDLASPLGKLLRLNDDLTIPTDNPFFATQGGLARAVWAYGLRNPFTLAVQAQGGRVHINDVGQSTWEEINLGVAGANYGWPASEGPDNVGAGITAPLFAYSHVDASPAGSGPGGFVVGLAITGGAFYPATGPFPEGWRGQYFFADHVNRFIGVLDLANGHAAYHFGRVADAPVGLRAGIDGALYVLTRSGIVRVSASPSTP